MAYIYTHIYLRQNNRSSCLTPFTFLKMLRSVAIDMPTTWVVVITTGDHPKSLKQRWLPDILVYHYNLFRPSNLYFIFVSEQTRRSRFPSMVPCPENRMPEEAIYPRFHFSSMASSQDGAEGEAATLRRQENDSISEILLCPTDYWNSRQDYHHN